MNPFARYFPWLVVGVTVIVLAALMIPPDDAPGEMKILEFGKLPAVEGGRVKPLDTVARNSLMVISSRQDFKDQDGKTQPAIKWLLDVMTTDSDAQRWMLAVMTGAKSGPVGPDAAPPDGGAAWKHKVFRIENDQVLGWLELELRPGSFRYSFQELAPKLKELQRESDRARKIEEKDQALFDVKVLELAKHVQLFVELSIGKNPLVLPPAKEGGEWESLVMARMHDHMTGRDRAAVRSFDVMLAAYAWNRPDVFNQELATYQQRLADRLPDQLGPVRLEVFFNHFAPFYYCCGLYVVMFVLACCSFLGWTEPLNRSALWLGVLTLVVHTWALFTRMYLLDRPLVFVTNLYSSAVFIGWAAVGLGLALEAFFRNGIGNLVASVLGFLTTLIAHHLARSGDTLEMMQAVLDTNFWLATHVTCITLGYTATFVAGFLGVAYIVLGVMTPVLTKELGKTLSQMIYGVVCFATLLSFTGTVLGGIWADQSWGRFWGWDPKENGALLIVLWNALILHARWGGLIKQAGMAVLAVVGNMVTGWSWFGTNQLGVGLHAYGFNNTLATGLTVFWGVMVACIIVGLLPRRLWLSFSAQQAALHLPPVAAGLAPRGRRDSPGSAPPSTGIQSPPTGIRPSGGKGRRRRRR